MDGKQRKITKSHKEKISKSRKGKRNAIETEFKIGHEVSDTMRNKISIRTKEAMKNPAIRKKISDFMKKHMKGNTISKGYKHTDESKKHMSKIMKGKATKWLKGKPSQLKGRKLSEKLKLKIGKAIHRHHKDLNRKNNTKRNILYLPPTIHQHLHHWAYKYLLETNNIKKYYKWFEKKENIKFKNFKNKTTE